MESKLLNMYVDNNKKQNKIKPCGANSVPHREMGRVGCGRSNFVNKSTVYLTYKLNCAWMHVHQLTKKDRPAHK